MSGGYLSSRSTISAWGGEMRERGPHLGNALRLVGSEASAGLVVRDEIVVEERLSLGLRQLNGLQAADVARAKQVDPAAELPGDALIDDDVAVLVG